MVTKEEEDLFDHCFQKWGLENQAIKLIEELSELIQSTSKDLYFNDPVRTLNERLDHFAEEIADSQLMIDEFIHQLKLKESVEYWRIIKAERLEKRLKG